MTSDAKPSLTILEAQKPVDVAAVRQLFIDYAVWLGVDLTFQDFDAEIATFPNGYDCLLLARAGDAPAGAVGLRPFEPGICEMKRLFVPDSFRGLGLGRALSVRLIEEARKRGYRIMRLDTLDRLKPALALYEALGFRPCPPYYDNPLEGAVFLELAL